MSWLSWIAAGFAIIGAGFAAKKKTACWYLWLVSNICWIIYAIVTKQWAIAITEGVFICLNVYGIFEWGKKPKQDLYKLCDAVVKLERMGYRWLVDFGYGNAVEIFERKTNDF